MTPKTSPLLDLINAALNEFHADKEKRFCDPMFLVRFFEAQAEVELTIADEQAAEIVTQVENLAHEFPAGMFSH